MFKQFELFEKMPTTRTSTSIRVSLNPRGSFTLNRKAFEALNEPETVELYFDKTSRLVGMKACSPELRHAYPVKKQGTSNSWLVRGRAFCNYYNIRIPITVVFDDIEVEDGMVILDLQKVRETDQRKPRKKKEGRIS